MMISPLWIFLAGTIAFPPSAQAAESTSVATSSPSVTNRFEISSPERPPSENNRPKDFNSFWKRTREESASIPLDVQMTLDSAQSDASVQCFKTGYLSLRRARVHAWYCRPTSTGPFPAVLINPWYGEERVDPPKDLARRGLAVLWYQARGFDVDQSSYPVENHWYILSGIENPEIYVYREIVSHALRGLDFLASRPEIDSKRIGAGGASQGGGLALILAGLDSRVAVASADFPFLSDLRDSISTASGPAGDVRDYLKKNPDKRDSVLRTLSYFDALNFADSIRIPVLVQAGLRDDICPAAGVRKVYHRIPSGRKQLRVYLTAGHGDQNALRWESMTNFLVKHLLPK